MNPLKDTAWATTSMPYLFILPFRSNASRFIGCILQAGYELFIFKRSADGHTDRIRIPKQMTGTGDDPGIQQLLVNNLARLVQLDH